MKIILTIIEQVLRDGLWAIFSLKVYMLTQKIVPYIEMFRVLFPE